MDSTEASASATAGSGTAAKVPASAGRLFWCVFAALVIANGLMVAGAAVAGRTSEAYAIGVPTAGIVLCAAWLCLTVAAFGPLSFLSLKDSAGGGQAHWAGGVAVRFAAVLIVLALMAAHIASMVALVIIANR
jgi:hypothetical protein